MTDERLIEEAKAGLAAFDAYWGDGGPVAAAYGRPWEIIRRLLAVFERAHTPTDDEREALVEEAERGNRAIQAHDHRKLFGNLRKHERTHESEPQGEPAYPQVGEQR